MIWLSNGDAMSAPSMDAIRVAGGDRRIFVSPISAWEIGMISRPKSGVREKLEFRPDPETWFFNFLAAPTMMQAAFVIEIAMAGGLLPPAIHGDPCDRLLMATARHLDIPIVTRDRKIIAYGHAGYVEVIEC